MALFGRESARHQARAASVRAWVAARSPAALLSALFGLMAVVDSFTAVLGMLLGGVAIGLGVKGRIDLRRRPHLLGARLCQVGIALGLLGLLIGVLLLTVIWPL